jgi:putative N-acetylmannosamine-6-phosphate epimerase
MNTDYTPVHVIGSGLAGYEAEAKAKEEAVRLQLYGRTEAADKEHAAKQRIVEIQEKKEAVRTTIWSVVIGSAAVSLILMGE